jgi:ribonuclease Y
MTSTDFFIAGAAIFLTGILFGFWLLRRQERTLRAALGLQEKALLGNARREAEAITREAKLAANEEALKLRTETEQMICIRHKEISTIEQRLNEREGLLSRQLESLNRSAKMNRQN